MPLKRTTVTTGTGRHDLAADVLVVGDDLVVVISGGDRAHLGAVAVAQPRPSLADPRRRSATASTIGLLGHKEDELARAVALRLASALGVPAAVTAGMHWDEISEDEIQTVLRKGEILAELIVESFRKTPGHQD